MEVGKNYILKKIDEYKISLYPCPKWLIFCKLFIDEGFDVRVYFAKKTVSKYCYIRLGKKCYKVRFSNHSPSDRKVITGDCDFFVGRTRYGITSTEDAIFSTRKFFSSSLFID